MAPHERHHRATGACVVNVRHDGALVKRCPNLVAPGIEFVVAPRPIGFVLRGPRYVRVLDAAKVERGGEGGGRGRERHRQAERERQRG